MSQIDLKKNENSTATQSLPQVILKLKATCTSACDSWTSYASHTAIKSRIS